MEAAIKTGQDTFRKVRDFATNIGLVITHVDADEELIVVEDPERGISSMVIDCEEPVLEIKQVIMDLPAGSESSLLFERLLQMNEVLVHGAFTLSEESDRIFFRDTLRLATLDQDELEGTVSALELALLEFGDELIALRHTLD